MASPLTMLALKLQAPWADGVTLMFIVPVEEAAMFAGGGELSKALQLFMLVMLGVLHVNAAFPVFAMV